MLGAMKNTDRPAREFVSRPMKLSVLTAAFQELTPRDRRDPDPDLAIEEWLEFSRDIGSPNIQLSAALARSTTAAANFMGPWFPPLGRRGTALGALRAS